MVDLGNWARSNGPGCRGGRGSGGGRQHAAHLRRHLGPGAERAAPGGGALAGDPLGRRLQVGSPERSKVAITDLDRRRTAEETLQGPSKGWADSGGQRNSRGPISSI